MSKYVVEVNRHYTYEIEIEADDEMEAIEHARDYDIEDLEPHETDAYFNYEISEYLDEE